MSEAEAEGVCWVVAAVATTLGGVLRFAAGLFITTEREGGRA